MGEVELNWEFLKAQLPPGWRELAVELDLIRPQPPQLQTKVTDIEQVLRPLLLRVGWDVSLQTTMATIGIAKAAAEADGLSPAETKAGDPAAVEPKEAQAQTPPTSLVEMSAVTLHKWEKSSAPTWPSCSRACSIPTPPFLCCTGQALRSCWPMGQR